MGISYSYWNKTTKDDCIKRFVNGNVDDRYIGAKFDNHAVLRKDP